MVREPYTVSRPANQRFANRRICDDDPDRTADQGRRARHAWRLQVQPLHLQELRLLNQSSRRSGDRAAVIILNEILPLAMPLISFIGLAPGFHARNFATTGSRTATRRKSFENLVDSLFR